MAYTIKDDCILRDGCQPECPNVAIKSEVEPKDYWIDPTLCDGCPDVKVPRCVAACNVGSLTPLQPKKGRRKSTLLPPAIPAIFLNGKMTAFASSIVVWEACNVLAQPQLWRLDADGHPCYRRAVHRGRGEMQFRLAADPESDSPAPMTIDCVAEVAAQFDILAACVHLLFEAYAITVDCPWEEPFVLNDQLIEQYLDLDKRKDLTKLAKLTLIKALVYQSCQLLVTLDWPRQGNVQAFSSNEQPVWQLLDTDYYFEEDAQGYRHLIGLGFTVRAGIWAKHFLNKRDYRRQTAFYQYDI